MTLPDGVSTLTGRNATNRTSFLQVLMPGLGSRQSSLKGDAKNGEVTFDFDDETFTRTLQCEGNSIKFSGDPYLDDPELADLFAFLLQGIPISMNGCNELRRLSTSMMQTTVALMTAKNSTRKASSFSMIPARYLRVIVVRSLNLSKLCQPDLTNIETIVG